MIFSFNLFAGDVSPKKKLFNMTLEELLNLKVVSSSSIAQKFSIAPSVVTIITKEQIEHFGYTSVAECIASVAGIDLLFNYNQYNVGIRGITADIIDLSRIFKLMINNVVVNFKSKGSDFLDEELIPISAIERIEIIRGPNSVNYGANAYLGVVNIITKQESNQSEIEIKSGSYNKKISYGGDFYKSGKLFNFNYVFAGAYDNKNFYKIKYKDIRNNKISTTSDNKDQDISLFTRISKNNIVGNDKISLQFIYQNQLSDVNFIDIDLFSNKAQEHLDNYNLNLYYNKNFYNKVDLQSSLTFSCGGPLADDKFYKKSSGAELSYYKRDFGYKSLQFNNRLKWNYNKRLSMSFGIDNIWDDFDLLDYIFVTDGTSVSLSGLPFDRKKITNTGIDYQMNYIFFKDMINFNAGIRYDINSEYDDVFTKRFGISFELYYDIYVKLLAGSSYKPPEIIQLYSNLIKVGGILSNPDLKPQKSHFHEFSLIKKVRNNILLSLSLYRVKVFDHIVYKKMVGTTNLYPINQSDIVSHGLEFEANYTKDNINLYFNYSFVDSRYSKELFNYCGENKKVVFEMNLYPKHMIKFGITRNFDRFVKYISLEGSYFSKRRGSESNFLILDAKNPFVSYKLDDYFLAVLFLRTEDIQIKELLNMNMYVKIRNLLNSEFYYPGFDGYDIGGFSRYFEFGLNFTF